MGELHWMVEPHGDSRETRIVSAILKDVTDRRGWRQEWDMFEERIKREIVAKWIEKVRALLEPEMASPARTLEEIKVAAALDAPDFRQMAEKAIVEALRVPESHADFVEFLEAYGKKMYATGVREASGGANGIANRLMGDRSSEEFMFFAKALDELAEQVHPRGKVEF